MSQKNIIVDGQFGLFSFMLLFVTTCNSCVQKDWMLTDSDKIEIIEACRKGVD